MFIAISQSIVSEQVVYEIQFWSPDFDLHIAMLAQIGFNITENHGTVFKMSK